MRRGTKSSTISAPWSRRSFGKGLSTAAMLPLLGCDFSGANAAAEATRPFESFLGKDNGDCSQAMAAAADWSARTGGTVTFAGSYRLTRTAVIKQTVKFHFTGARFVIDGSPKAAISNGAVGTIGILFQDAPGISLSGDLSVSGSDRSGQTSLAGIVFDSCPQARAGAHFTFQYLAVGMFAYWCDDGLFGDIDATFMKGRQPFEFVSSAGSTLVAAGCRSSQFGTLRTQSNYKPVLYCSVVFDRNKRAIDNQQCSFGAIQATPFAGSAESSLIALRSARNCTFAGATGRGFACGYYIGRYIGDDGFSVDGNRLGPLVGDFPGTAFSTDAALVQEAEGPSVPIGANHVDSITATCGGEFGAAVFSGTLTFYTIQITGSTRPVVVKDAALRGTTIIVSNQQDEAITLGGASDLAVTTVDIRSGSIGGEGSAIRYNEAFGVSDRVSIKLDRIRYRRNGIGVALQFVIYDPNHAGAVWRVGNVEGDAVRAHGRFRGSATMRFENGRAMSVWAK